MPRYTQLSSEERRLLSRLIQLGQSQRKIAFTLARNPSTISRELRRNRKSIEHLYVHDVAHKIARVRRKNRPYTPKFTKETIQWIERKLTTYQWSPEQIAGRLKFETGANVSHEWIYQWVLKNRRNGGMLYLHLRRSHRKNKKRYAVARKSTTRFGEARSIETRPEIVEKRERLGDWEGDTIVGLKQSSGIVSLVERVSCFARLQLVPTRQAHQVRNAVVGLLKNTNGPKHTITFDRGSEFAYYESVERELKLETYFAHPYSSFERGTNENTNGLVRQYFPKKTDFTGLDPRKIKKVEWLLNNRPRKKLGYMTPHEKYFAFSPYPKNRDKPDMRDWKQQYQRDLKKKECYSEQDLTPAVALES